MKLTPCTWLKDYHLTKVQTPVRTFVHQTEENHGTWPVGEIFAVFAKNSSEGFLLLI
jgi:hypothetical protein